MLDAGLEDFIKDLVSPLVKKPDSTEMQFVHDQKQGEKLKRQIVF